MGFNLPGSGADLTPDSLKREVEKKLVAGLGVNDTLAGLAEAEDEGRQGSFAAALQRLRPNDWQKFWEEGGSIDRAALSEMLTTREKFALLVSQLLGDQLLSVFFPKAKNGESFQSMTMEEAITFYTAHPDKGARRVSGGGQEHLVWDQTGVFSPLTALFGLRELSKESKKAGEEAPFPLIGGTFLLVNMRLSSSHQGPQFTPTLFDFLEKLCARNGLRLRFVKPGEPTGAPEADEVGFSPLPPSSIPLTPEGKVDYTLLDWYASLYEEAPWCLAFGSPLLAAVRMRLRGPNENAEAALQNALEWANMANAPADFKESLKAILPAGQQPPASEAAPTEPAASSSASATSTDTQTASTQTAVAPASSIPPGPQP